MDALMELRSIIDSPATPLNLTDSPCVMTQARALERKGVSGVYAVQVALRILTRQCGQATPAQVLLFLAHRHVMPTLDRSLLMADPVAPLDRKRLQTWVNCHLTVKQANAMLRITDSWGGSMAWLLHANQSEIQVELRKLCLPVSKGVVRLDGTDGLEGWLREDEVFPPPPPGQQTHRRDRSWLVLCGGDDHVE